MLAIPLGHAKEWKKAGPSYQWSFPEDHWARHDYKTEWWYFTGHLRSVDDPSRRFGYQFTFFRIGLSPTKPDLPSAWAAKDLIMGHAVLSDLEKKQHRFSEVLFRAIPLLGGFGSFPDSRVAWSRGPVGTDGLWELVWNGEAYDFSMVDEHQKISLELSTKPLKPLIFQGPNGVSRKGEGDAEASHYYSFTRLETEGKVGIDGEEFSVRGESWMDKEFGSNQLGNDKVGWDWFSLQLDDGRELMLYLLRSKDGKSDFASGTLVARNGAPEYLTPGDWRLSATGSWHSPESEAVYPAGWILELPKEALRLKIVPTLADQENRSDLLPGLNYWEGSVDVLAADDAPAGRGYVELTGYGEKSRPPI